MNSTPAGPEAALAALSTLKSGNIAPIPTAMPAMPSDKMSAVPLATPVRNAPAPRIHVEASASS